MNETADLFTRLAPYGFDSGATFSPCRLYRYHLWRAWGDREKRVAFIGLNPSTADETEDDPTIRRCIGFAKRWGFGAYDMLNLFAWRSTDPMGIVRPDPIGVDNDATILRVAKSAGRVVLCWGSHKKLGHLVPERAVAVRALLASLSGRVGHLGRNHDGMEKHPLYLPNTTSFVPVKP